MEENEKQKECSQCGGPKIDLTKAMCETCREKRKQKARKMSEKRVKQGLCPNCSKPSDRKGHQCSLCLRAKLKIALCKNPFSRVMATDFCRTCGINKINLKHPEYAKSMGFGLYENCSSCRRQNVEKTVNSRNSILSLMGECCIKCKNTDLNMLTVIPREPMNAEDYYTFWRGSGLSLSDIYIDHWMSRLFYCVDKYNGYEPDYTPAGQFPATLEEAKNKYEVSCFNCYANKKINEIGK